MAADEKRMPPTMVKNDVALDLGEFPFQGAPTSVKIPVWKLNDKLFHPQGPAHDHAAIRREPKKFFELTRATMEEETKAILNATTTRSSAKVLKGIDGEVIDPKQMRHVM